MFLFQDRNNKKIWNFDNEVFSLMPFTVQIFKSKISFRDVPEGNHGIFLKNTVKMEYPGNNKSELFSEYS